MAYIIDNVPCIEYDRRRDITMLVEDNTIRSINSNFKRYTFPLMNVSPFLMSPVHVMADLELPDFLEFHHFKSYFTTEFLMKGCTALITSFSIDFQSQFELNLRRTRTSLLSSPIDYVLVLRCKAKLVAPDLIRQLKRNKIPAVFIEFSSEEELRNIAWGWVREALYGYPLVFCPLISPEIDKRRREKLLNAWQEILRDERIPHIQSPLSIKRPLPLQFLKKIGIYPLKGNFMVGGEISYNLYESPASEIVAHCQSFLYDNHMLILTVNKGKVLMSNGRCFFQPGIGEELMIKNPGYLI
ncbi:hypothetical protein FZC84_03310 [Rossellomorea vietnamensis]|uniref:Uncharacterized protein n=1 Tax=Rossellomorea vietnamensis TaxID=218284 RepID=A0A5D4MGA5_9BACI|nr:hypothetical protein [Rossellomorea vietnamensis]TYS00537.1 hypothetical protein FZC84_03310 [Rossellomorea vietnamensis]